MLYKNPIFALIQTGWKYAGNRRHLIIIYLVLFACSAATFLAEPYIVGRLLNCVQASATSHFADSSLLLHQIFIYLGFLFLTQVCIRLFHMSGRLIEHNVAFHIKAAYKLDMFKIVTELPLQWHREHHSGDSIDKMNKAATAIERFFDSTFEISYMIFRLIGAQAILFGFMPAAGWASLVASLFSVANIVLFDRIVFRNCKALNKFSNRVAAAVHDYVTNIISVITLRLQEPVTVEVLRRLQVSLPLFKTTHVLFEVKYCLVTIIIAIMQVVVLSSYAWMCLSARKPLMGGTFFTLFEYLRRIGESFYTFAALYGRTVEQAADVENAMPLFESHARLGDSGQGDPMKTGWRSVAVQHLYFTYSDDKQRVHHLEDVYITLEKGKAIALVGESGSGKSTLLNLLRGMQEPDRVTLSCNGAELPHQLRHLAEITTLLPQDPEIFADTIRFNITFGLDATEEQIDDALRMARFDAVLARLPDGLETNIAEKGVNLSGGEKQRLALARGIFFAKGSDILLLDEPTSSVDQQNERLIYKEILHQFKEKCIVSSVHKLNLLDLFDEIYVFSDGSVIDRGPLNELLKKGGYLAELWKGASDRDEIAQSALVDALQLRHHTVCCSTAIQCHHRR